MTGFHNKLLKLSEKFGTRVRRQTGVRLSLLKPALSPFSRAYVPNFSDNSYKDDGVSL